MPTPGECSQSMHETTVCPEENSLQRSFSFAESRYGDGGVGLEFLLYLGLGQPVLNGDPDAVPSGMHDDENGQMSGDDVLYTAAGTILRRSISVSGDFKFLEPKLYECGYCHLTFGDRKKYFRHLRKHANNIMRCVGCNKSFRSIINKNVHQARCRRLRMF